MFREYAESCPPLEYASSAAFALEIASSNVLGCTIITCIFNSCLNPFVNWVIESPSGYLLNGSALK